MPTPWLRGELPGEVDGIFVSSARSSVCSHLPFFIARRYVDARYWYWISSYFPVCLSVSPFSATLWCCVNEHINYIVKLFQRLVRSSFYLVSAQLRLHKIPTVILNAGTVTEIYEKSCVFRPKLRISEKRYEIDHFITNRTSKASDRFVSHSMTLSDLESFFFWRISGSCDEIRHVNQRGQIAVERMSVVHSNHIPVIGMWKSPPVSDYMTKDSSRRPQVQQSSSDWSDEYGANPVTLKTFAYAILIRSSHK